MTKMQNKIIIGYYNTSIRMATFEIAYHTHVGKDINWGSSRRGAVVNKSH